MEIQKNINSYSSSTSFCSQFNDFVEKDLLHLYDDKQQQQQSQPCSKYNQKIRTLQNGIESMKQMIEEYQQQLTEIQLLQQQEQLNLQNSNSFQQQQQQIVNNFLLKQNETQSVKSQPILIPCKPIRKSKKISKYAQKKLKFACRFCKQKFPIDQHRVQHEKNNHKVKIIKVNTLEELSEFKNQEDQEVKNNQTLEQQIQNNMQYDQNISWEKSYDNSTSHNTKEDLFFMNDIDFQFQL